MDKERKPISISLSVPKMLGCPLCKKLCNDAVLISCCGTSFCDKCIRPEDPSDEITCPNCKRFLFFYFFIIFFFFQLLVVFFKISLFQIKM